MLKFLYKLYSLIILGISVPKLLKTTLKSFFYYASFIKVLKNAGIRKYVPSFNWSYRGWSILIGNLNFY